MAIGEVAGSTVSTAFASTKLNSTERSAQQELQASAQANAEDTSNTEETQLATARTDESSTGSSSDPSRGTRLDITV